MLNKIIINIMLIFLSSTAISLGNPTTLPSSMPTTLPSSMPSNLPSLLPSTFFPTGGPTAEPTGFPTITPTSYFITDCPTLAPSASPSFSPSASPTLAPSFTPSFTPTFEPSFSPTLAPSFIPTFEPSFIPTFEPSFTPTFEPSFTPTFEPSSVYIPIGTEVISFPASIKYSGITVSIWNENIDENNDVACTATTNILNIPKSGCQVTGLTDSNVRRILIDNHLRRLLNSGVIVTTQITAPIKNNESNSTYNILTNTLQQSVDDGSFTSALIVSAIATGSIILQSVTVPTQVVVAEPYIELSYTASPSFSPSFKPKHQTEDITDKPVFIVVYISITIFVVIVLYLVRQIRTKRLLKRDYNRNEFISNMSTAIVTKLADALDSFPDDNKVNEQFEIEIFENTAQL